MLGETNLIPSLAGATDRDLSNIQIIIIIFSAVHHHHRNQKCLNESKPQKSAGSEIQIIPSVIFGFLLKISHFGEKWLIFVKIDFRMIRKRLQRV